MTRAEKLEELVRLVRGMRESQREFYRHRDRTQLLDAKERERMVDDALAWIGEREEIEAAGLVCPWCKAAIVRRMSVEHSGGGSAIVEHDGRPCPKGPR